VLAEPQIYRIDHYLGKETVQNIMAFRFGNGIFEPVWNRRYVDHVQITASEEVGVELRGGYYDESGAMRDMVPNHLFQLISLTAMEPPTSFDANAVRDEQTKSCAPSTHRRGRVTHRARTARRHRQSAVPAYRSERQPHPNTETRGAETGSRQLALGRRAVLPAHGQTHDQAADRDRDPVQARAIHAVPQGRRRE
jgi:glucose-6-phosphate 1-dehydrogenase